MVTLSELQTKEVIIISDGKRVGHISDLEIDPIRGRITALIVYLREKNGLFGKADELIIYWDQIVTIGIDVILVRDANGQRLLID
ncbi:sporulation protein, YlmC/YmxH family [Oceanobacillus limi]|uniref:Sporulation protein, YlmC/YmxH family n=1 Tax=Oceanobacillus limi TaxID=930131 RepID=A0A1I0DEC0_9BACI|nr:YlmC/YmxH family sporulation protein [Oceanobacillus limi]SET30605.1 sporulation protein, YlmC/YmxH family [Oceanobacillus limi]